MLIAPQATATLTIIGGGGHAKEVLATARSQGWPDDAIVVVDDAPGAQGKRVLGHVIAGTGRPVLGDPSALAVIAVGANRVRDQLAGAARCRFATLVHASAVVHESAVLGAGTVVFATAAIQPDAALGAHVIVGTGACVSHDCVVGQATHLAPGVRLAGAVKVGARVLLGVGAVVLPGISIGDDAIVGGGAAVTRDVPAGATVVGVPARVVKR